MIRSADSNEARVLTRISFASKGYWNYPQGYFDLWRNELTIGAEYILDNDVFVFEHDGLIVGYYSIVELQDDIDNAGIRIDKGYWLEHMFVDPQYIGFGIGTLLFQHILERCRARGIGELKILADPNTIGFYEKMGCVYRGEYPSTIAHRTTPLLCLPIKSH